MKRKITSVLAFSLLAFTATAQGSSGLGGVTTEVTNMLKDIVPIIKILALLMLIWAVVSLIMALATKSQDVKSKALYAVIALAVYVILGMLTTQYGASSIGW